MIGKGPALGPEQLLVRSDGMPTNAPRRDVSRIPSLIDLNMVERIELVAGASSLYGAGATGGAISTAIRGFPRISAVRWRRKPRSRSPARSPTRWATVACSRWRPRSQPSP
jgi:outer membrane receptor protein involved in Fe transport